MTIPSQVAQERPSKKLTARSGLVALLVEVTRRGPVHGLLVLIGFFLAGPLGRVICNLLQDPRVDRLNGVVDSPRGPFWPEC